MRPVLAGVAAALAAHLAGLVLAFYGLDKYGLEPWDGLDRVSIIAAFLSSLSGVVAYDAAAVIGSRRAGVLDLAGPVLLYGVVLIQTYMIEAMPAPPEGVGYGAHIALQYYLLGPLAVASIAFFALAAAVLAGRVMVVRAAG